MHPKLSQLLELAGKDIKTILTDSYIKTQKWSGVN